MRLFCYLFLTTLCLTALYFAIARPVFPIALTETKCGQIAFSGHCH
jgi:hypothetical protein